MTPQGFEDLVRPYRRELAAHCYRMLGSLADAEDQVQETLVSAWRGIDGFEGRSSVRAWLYKIATNRCLDLLRTRPRRGMPIEHGAPLDPLAPLPGADPELLWVEPGGPALIDATPANPEASYAGRESIQLAFIVALQHLPATQRATVILREVLGWSAAEVAELLDTSVAAVNSALQRGRATLDARRARPPSPRLDDAAREALLARYMRAWEAGDADALAALLRDDVVASMPPLPGWFRGRDALVTFIRGKIGAPGVQRVVRVAAADEIAFAFYRRDQGSEHHEAHAIQIVVLAGGAVAEIHAFLDPSLFPRFGLPMQLRSTDESGSPRTSPRA